MKYFMELSYHGKFFHGWQIQPNVKTVQGTLQVILSLLLGEEINLVGGGRTDAGVHALSMIVHLETSYAIDKNELIDRCNSYLKNQIVINKVQVVPETAHARFDAISRRYKYFILQKRNAFRNEFAWYRKEILDVDYLNILSDKLLKYNDFACFAKTNSDVKTTLCQLIQAKWKHVNDELCLTIEADRFLRNMVRAIVGTLVQIVTKHRPEKGIKELEKIINSKNRNMAGPSVPAKGLFLTNIKYPKDIYES